MNKWLLAILLSLSLGWAYAQQDVNTESTANSGAEENYQFADEQQRQLFLTLTAELRCPLCQNQNIADSDAMIAHDMRRKVYQLIQQGNDEQQVLDFMKSRYGDFVHYQPPVTPYTMWLWLLPVLFAVFALVMITRKQRVQEPSDLEEKLARADELLKREE
ncbi:cytochrome c-type biogenesis protein CcmH [Alteromonas sp. ASW11-36]|uniref:Cytochrome c-type biogenesis protein n=1 Tax=Alteromonas arenosi TaxID=3055817 RepID=A0ABT7T0L5_9ALTE|nr:cytochrome c-type biogenesis protein [Alteromonas sp. ASW11-36]MDM7861963.1 cytochrome c-type biogenesis protein CcmH [Alteromonas sp. ASW11-36]